MVAVPAPKIIFRCDDVSANTDMKTLHEMFMLTLDSFNCEFWSVVSMFSSETSDGAVYPGAPFKDYPRSFFYSVDKLSSRVFYPGKVVSHGLLHLDHSQLQFDAQEMSIVTSCNYLNADTFVPPFNRYNEATEAVCRMNNIRLVKFQEGWRCLDREDFDPNHKLWYFHPWKFTIESFRKKLNVICKEA